MNKYDCVVIGCGPCGISTAIYLKRYGYFPIVIAKDLGALEKAHLIENYYGISSITGHDLALKGIEQAKKLDIEVAFDEVIDISYGDSFEVVCKNNTYKGRTVMLALGTNRNKFSLAEKYEGMGVSYCATCDGFFFRKKRVGIIGSGEYMLHELNVLKNMISDLTVFTNEEELLVDVGDTKVISDKIISLNGDGHLESITTTNGTYEIYQLFVATGSASGFSLAKHLGLGLNGNSLLVDSSFMTNIDGIFAGGDVVGGLLQVSKAISDGANAALGISKYLKR